jgi:PAS domain S-box-containing protein
VTKSAIGKGCIVSFPPTSRPDQAGQISENSNGRPLQQQPALLQGQPASFEGLGQVFMDGPDPVLIKDLSGHILNANREAERFYGWSRAELIGRSVTQLIPPEHQAQAAELRRRCRMGEKLRNIRILHCNKQSQPHPVLVSFVLLADGQGEPAGIALFVKNTAQEVFPAELKPQLEEQAEQVRRLALSLALAEHSGRSRISRALHDNLQQLLISLLIRLELLKGYSGPETADTLDQFNQATHALNQAIEMTRVLAVELDPPVLHAEGLEEALLWLVSHMEDIYRFNVQLSIQRPAGLRNKNIETLLLQMTRELLFNVLWHADIDQAQLELDRRDGQVMIHVKDEGRGFDVDQFRARRLEQQASGLFNIERWLSLLGGRLDIEAKPGRGASVTISLPAV